MGFDVDKHGFVVAFFLYPVLPILAGRHFGRSETWFSCGARPRASFRLSVSTFSLLDRFLYLILTFTRLSTRHRTLLDTLWALKCCLKRKFEINLPGLLKLASFNNLLNQGKRKINNLGVKIKRCHGNVRLCCPDLLLLV